MNERVNKLAFLKINLDNFSSDGLRLNHEEDGGDDDVDIDDDADGDDVAVEEYTGGGEASVMLERELGENEETSYNSDIHDE